MWTSQGLNLGPPDYEAYRQRPAEQGDSATPLDKHPHRQPPPPADPRQAAREELDRGVPHGKEPALDLMPIQRHTRAVME